MGDLIKHSEFTRLVIPKYDLTSHCSSLFKSWLDDDATELIAINSRLSAVKRYRDFNYEHYVIKKYLHNEVNDYEQNLRERQFLPKEKSSLSFDNAIINSFDPMDLEKDIITIEWDNANLGEHYEFIKCAKIFAAGTGVGDFYPKQETFIYYMLKTVGRHDFPLACKIAQSYVRNQDNTWFNIKMCTHIWKTVWEWYEKLDKPNTIPYIWMPLDLTFDLAIRCNVSLELDNNKITLNSFGRMPELDKLSSTCLLDVELSYVLNRYSYLRSMQVEVALNEFYPEQHKATPDDFEPNLELGVMEFDDALINSMQTISLHEVSMPQSITANRNVFFPMPNELDCSLESDNSLSRSVD